MGQYALIPPAVRWGTNYASAVYVPFPLDNGVSYEDPRPGSAQIQGPSGTEDAWTVGWDSTLEGDLRWLTTSSGVYYPRVTGWDGSNFVRDFFRNARDKNLFAWHPDGRNLLRLPLLNIAGSVALGGFGGWATSPTAGVTVTFDAGEPAWKITGTNSTGVTQFPAITQYVPAIPGETFTLSVDYKTLSLAGGAGPRLLGDASTITPTFISEPLDSGVLGGSVGYGRTGTTGSVTPATTAYLRVLLVLSMPNGSSGTVWFKNAMLRRDSTDATFIDNPSTDSYLVDPMSGAPAIEPDGTRRIHIKIRNSSTPYDGYGGG